MEMKPPEDALRDTHVLIPTIPPSISMSELPARSIPSEMLVATSSAVPPLAGTSATTMPSAMRAMVFPERATTLSPNESCPLLTAAGTHAA